MKELTKRQRIGLFVTLLILGLMLQPMLGFHCRCHWGAYDSQMIYGAFVVDLWVIIRLIVAAFRREFLRQCVPAGVIVATSVFWIPIVFKLALAIYLLTQGEPIHNLFH
jgi:hypothetical protein